MNQYKCEIWDYLEPGERVVWTGGPESGIRFGKGDLLGSIFLIMWLAVLLAMLVLGSEDIGGHIAIVVVPLLLFGFHALATRHYTDAAQRRRSQYGITNQRLIATGRYNLWCSLDSISNLQLLLHKDGTGTLLCTCQPKSLNGRIKSDQTEVPIFEYVRNPEALIPLMPIAMARPTKPRWGDAQNQLDRRTAIERFGHRNPFWSTGAGSLRRWLLRSEQVLWTGKPHPSPGIAWNDVLAAILAALLVILVWLLVIEVQERRDPRNERTGALEDWQYALFLVAATSVIAYGLYVSIIRHLIEWFQRRSTTYWVTDERVIIEEWSRTRFIPISCIRSTSVVARGGDRGSLRCASDYIDTVGGRRERHFTGFLMIDVDGVGEARRLIERWGSDSSRGD